MALKEIRLELAQLAKQVKHSEYTFFKTGKGEYSEHDKFLGISVPNLRAIAKKYPDCTEAEIKNLLHSSYNDERFLALVMLTNNYASGSKAERKKICDFYMANLAHVNNWNLVDCSAHLILGRFIYENGLSVRQLEQLSKSKILWERRVAIVATWYLIRQGECSVTFKLCYKLLNDKEDLMHKACGWMLREAGKKDINGLKTFLEAYGLQMPRTMLRYAIERFPEAERKSYLKCKA